MEQRIPRPEKAGAVASGLVATFAPGTARARIHWIFDNSQEQIHPAEAHPGGPLATRAVSSLSTEVCASGVSPSTMTGPN